MYDFIYVTFKTYRNTDREIRLYLLPGGGDRKGVRWWWL